MTTAEAALERETAPASAGRWAITAVFLLNGLTLTSYIVRVPTLKIDHHLSNGQLGLMGTFFGGAALVAMQFVGASVARFGSARIIRLALLAMPIVLVGIGFSRGVVQLFVAVTVLGVVHGTLDVAMNAHAVAVERLRQRPIMSGCHAAWSISAVIASLTGAALIQARIPLDVHLLAVGLVVIVAGLVAGRFLLPATIDQRSEPQTKEPRWYGLPASWRTGWTRTLVLLGLTGLVLMICEGAALGWSGVFLHDNRGATLPVAAVAVTVYTGCQTSIRLIGDRLQLRYGSANLFRVGGAVGSIGLLLAVFSPAPPAAIAGFAVFGLGTAILLPLTFSAVGHAGGTGPGAAANLSRFSTFTYAGILLGPAVIGWVAQGIGLIWTLAALFPFLVAVALNGLPAARATRGREPVPAQRRGDS